MTHLAFFIDFDSALNLLGPHLIVWRSPSFEGQKEAINLYVGGKRCVLDLIFFEVPPKISLGDLQNEILTELLKHSRMKSGAS